MSVQIIVKCDACNRQVYDGMHGDIYEAARIRVDMWTFPSDRGHDGSIRVCNACYTKGYKVIIGFMP